MRPFHAKYELLLLKLSPKLAWAIGLTIALGPAVAYWIAFAFGQAATFEKLLLGPLAYPLIVLGCAAVIFLIFVLSYHQRKDAAIKSLEAIASHPKSRY